ncbi:purine nucleoside phosphorylase-like [Podarcis lilfordi]|uniref:Purine nucleoside phosphorylase-like n=1 Tax=Podarcis lilfordi TaxID=74358 RepID=A0AA35KHY4_9SAUR|nr:purine nucleoside phosphorylase-like [Podarcis lilfordi]
MQPTENFSFELCRETADWLLARTRQRPRIAIICGSGLGPLADSLKNPESFKYMDIPNFPHSTVSGHDGQLLFGELHGKPCVCMKGASTCTRATRFGRSRSRSAFSNSWALRRCS